MPGKADTRDLGPAQGVPSQVETFYVTAQDPGGNVDTSTVTVAVNQTLALMTVAPSSAAVAEGQTRTFTASGTDQFGNPQTASPAWSTSGGGTFNASGLFTAGATPGGPYTITASSNAVVATASVTVTGLTITKAATAWPNPVTGTITNLTASATDNGYSTSTLTYTWAQSAGPAGDVQRQWHQRRAKLDGHLHPGRRYSFYVTVQDPGGNVAHQHGRRHGQPDAVVDQRLAGLGHRRRSRHSPFAASGKDQFGNALAVAPAWSTSGGGTINAAGLFTAGSAPGGPYTMTASSNAVNATASVTVTRPDDHQGRGRRA